MDKQRQIPGQVTVTVVIPFFNAGRFIAETIESVLAQTYTDWELLLVDDGSSDNSTAIAKKYAQAQPQKVFFIEHAGHANRGVCVTRNLGTHHARGRYVAFLDADDVWYPHKLSDQVKIMEQNPQAGMVCGAYLNWRNWDVNNQNQDKDEIRPTGAPQNSITMPPKLSEYLYPLGEGMSPNPSDLLIKKEVLKKTGGFEEDFTQEYQLFEDQGFLTKIYLSTPVYVSDKTWTKYRRHADQCMTVSRKAGNFDRIRKFYFNWLKKYLIQQGYRGTVIWALAQKELFPYEHPVLYKWQQKAEKTIKNIKLQLK